MFRAVKRFFANALGQSQPADPASLSEREQQRLSDQIVALYDQMQVLIERGRDELALEAVTRASELTAQLFGRDHPQHADSLLHVALLHERLDNLVEATQTYQEALRIKSQVYGEEHPELLVLLSQYARICKSWNDTTTAESLYRRMLRIREKTGGTADPDYASDLNELADVYRGARDYQRAAECVQRSLEIRRATLGDQHPDVAQSLNNLGSLAHAQGDLETAEEYFMQALALRRDSIDLDRPGDVQILNNLLTVYRETHNDAAADELMRQFPGLRTETRRIRDQAAEQEAVVQAFIDRDYVRCYRTALPLLPRGTSHEVVRLLLISLLRARQYEVVGELAPDLLSAGAPDSWEHLLLSLTLGEADPHMVLAVAEGSLQRCQAHFYVGAMLVTNQIEMVADDEFNAAIATRVDCLERRLAWIEKQHLTDVLHPPGDDPAGRIRSLNQEVSQLCAKHDYHAAQRAANEAYVLAEQFLDEDHDLYAQSVNRLALVQAGAGGQPVMDQMRNDTVKSLLSILGDGSDDVEDLLARARLHDMQGNSTEAIPLWEQVADLQRRDLAPDDPALADTLCQLASAYRNQGDFAAAVPLLEEALQIRQAAFGDNHPDVIEVCNNLGVIYRQMGKHAAAEPLLQRALKLSRGLFDDQHPQVAKQMMSLASLHRDLGRLGEAEDLLQRALAIHRDKCERESDWLPANMQHLADLYQQLGRLGEAQSLYQEALERFQSLPGDHRDDISRTLTGLAMLHRQRGQYKSAARFAQQSVDICRAAHGERHPAVGTSLTNLGLVYTDLGDFVSAEKMYRQALAIHREALGDSHPSVALSLNHLALFYRELGNHEAAEPLLLQALEIQQQVYGENHPDVAQTLNNLGLLYRSMGRVREVVPYYQRAIQVVRATLGESHLHVGKTLNNLADWYLSIADHQRAEATCREALAIYRQTLGEHHPEVARSLNNLAIICERSGKKDEVQEYLQQALSIQRTTFGQEHPSVATSLSNLAAADYDDGDLESAEANYRKALDIQESFFGQAHPGVALTLNNLALVCERRGDFEQAESMLRRAMEVQITSLGRYHPQVAATASNLGLLCAATDRVSEAFDLMREAFEIGDRAIGEVFSIVSEAQRVQYLYRAHIDLHACMSLMAQYLAESPPAVRAVADFVLRRKAILAETVASQRDAILRGRHPQLESQLRELATLRTQIAQRTIAGPGAMDRQEHLEMLENWNAEKEELETKLARQIPEMNQEYKLRVNCDEVLANLPQDAVLIELVRTYMLDFAKKDTHAERARRPDRYLAFVFSADRSSVEFVDLGEAAQVDQLIAEYRASIEPSAMADEDAPDLDKGRALRRCLFDPVASKLDSHRRLIIAPDGDLNKLPFEVLPTDDGRYLIDEFQFSYIAVGRDLLRFRRRWEGEPSRPVVMADPDFDLDVHRARAETSAAAPLRSPGMRCRAPRHLDWTEVRFDPLPETRQEGEVVARMLEVAPRLGSESTLSRLYADCRSPHILHLATHGFFAADPDSGRAPQLLRDTRLDAGGPHLENPLLRSGLALAGANTWIDWISAGSPPPEPAGGILTAEDVASLDLLNTELVVLSACETGLGEIHTGEGVMGLRRSFVQAGASTLVISLWKVPDEETQELMIDFYRRILDGEGRSRALRDAQLASKDRYPHPFFWGAFICQGNPAPLRQSLVMSAQE